MGNGKQRFLRTSESLSQPIAMGWRPLSSLMCFSLTSLLQMSSPLLFYTWAWIRQYNPCPARDARDKSIWGCRTDNELQRLPLLIFDQITLVAANCNLHPYLIIFPDLWNFFSVINKEKWCEKITLIPLFIKRYKAFMLKKWVNFIMIS